MAGSVSLLRHTKQQGITIAIHMHIHDTLPVAARCALDPDALTATAPVGHRTCRQGLAQGICVHVCNHQHFARLMVLCDSNDEAISAKANPIGKVFHVMYACLRSPNVRESVTKRSARGINSMRSWIKNAPRRACVALVRAYQIGLAPLMPASCRFVPSCSEYAIEALTSYGAFKGLVLTFWRLLRCNPWGPRGYDPPRWFVEPPSKGMAAKR